MHLPVLELHTIRARNVALPNFYSLTLPVHALPVKSDVGECVELGEEEADCGRVAEFLPIGHKK